MAEQNKQNISTSDTNTFLSVFPFLPQPNNKMSLIGSHESTHLVPASVVNLWEYVSWHIKRY